MGRPFIDADDAFTAAYGKTPAEVITKEGEETFRRMEHLLLRDLGKQSGIVLSTGGGAVTREENYAPLHQNGRIIFVHRSIDKLATFDRPLSVDLEALYKERLPAYRRFCDAEVSNDGSIEDASSCAS
jgi:shikimate dehydrogenase